VTIPAKYNDAESALGVVDELRSRLAYGLFPGLPVIIVYVATARTNMAAMCLFLFERQRHNISFINAYRRKPSFSI